MKKALMGTTALVAAAVTTGVAAEPISLTIGGNSHWGMAIVDNEARDDIDDLAISNDVELQLRGSTVLDSGVEVGVRFELEGEQSSDQMDETYAYIEGSFGTIRIGNDDAASYSMSTTAPYATYFYGINTPYWAGTFSGADSSDNWLSTLAGVGAGDSASVMYFSPVINGFQFGVSYAPERKAEAQSGTADMGKGDDVTSVGLRYDGAFGDAGVTVAGGYTNLEMEDAGTTVTDWSAGVVVSMSGVSVGGSYRTVDHDDGSDDEVHMDAGISYGEGAWAVSANYGNMSHDSEGVDVDMMRLLANYNIGPGINVAGGAGIDSSEAADDTTFAGIALAISF